MDVEKIEVQKTVQDKMLSALPLDTNEALNVLCIVLSYIADSQNLEKIDRTIWNEANKHAAGYRIVVEPQMKLDK